MEKSWKMILSPPILSWKSFEEFFHEKNCPSPLNLAPLLAHVWNILLITHSVKIAEIYFSPHSILIKFRESNVFSKEIAECNANVWFDEIYLWWEDVNFSFLHTVKKSHGWIFVISTLWRVKSLFVRTRQELLLLEYLGKYNYWKNIFLPNLSLNPLL